MDVGLDAHARPRRVSVVDDDQSVREALPDLLRELGFAVRVFVSAEEFLASDALATTESLILDIAMPGMSGPELQQELTRRAIDVPIVFITAQADDAIGDRLLARGAAAYIVKPFSDETLHAAVDASLRSR